MNDWMVKELCEKDFLRKPFTILIGSLHEKSFDPQDAANPVLLLPLAFAGGKSVTLFAFWPCSLSISSYIGSLNIKFWWDAFQVRVRRVLNY